MSVHYGYGRIFGIPDMPTLQQQKVACFDFCNKLDVEWGGFQGDDDCVRDLPFWRRQAGAEFLSLKVGGIIVASYAAAFGRRSVHFAGTIERCQEQGIRLYVLDIGEGEITGNDMVCGLATVLAEKSVPRREMMLEYNIQPGARANPPLGWKKIKTGFAKGQRYKLVPDHKIRAIALRAYAYFNEGMAAEEVYRRLRFGGHLKSPDWCKDAFKAVICGFPLETHRVHEAFSGFSLSAWKQRDPATLALLSRIADTFRQERARLLESSAQAQALRPLLEQHASVEATQTDQP